MEKYRSKEYDIYKLKISNVISNNNVLNNYIEIKNKIDYFYEQYKIKYVILFGDYEEITSRNLIPTFAYENGNLVGEGGGSTNTKDKRAASDFWYGVYPRINNISEATDNTFYNNIIIGRISPGDKSFYDYTNSFTSNMKKINVANQINKIIDYENYIDEIINKNLDNKWSKKVIGIGSNEGGAPFYDGLDGLSDSQYLRNELERYRKNNFSFSEFYDGYISPVIGVNDKNIEYDTYGNPNKNTILEKIDEGCSLVLYTGHADEISLSTSYLNTNDINKLKSLNKEKYFFMSLVGCSSGSYDEPFMAFAEKLLTVEKKGAIGVFSSTILQSWRPPMYTQRQFNNIIMNTSTTYTIGDLFKESVLHTGFLPTTPGNIINNVMDLWFYLIFGDPCTRLICTVPEIKNTFNNN